MTLWAFLGQVLNADQSCRAAVARLIAHRLSRGQRPCSAETGAYCQARRRLPETFFSDVACSVGRALDARAEQDWLFNYFLVDEGALDARDRAVYERAYDSADAIRASNAWYQTVTQDIIDYRAYGKLDMPVLAMGGPAYRWMKKVVPAKATNLTTVNVEHSGHFIQEEQPEFVTKTMLDFLQGPDQVAAN